jgi:NADP-dependent alcohol dehydrogenase
MNNFIFKNPTKLIFGKGMIAELKNELPVDKRILITFGSGSVKKNGIYQQVVEALKGRNFVEFWGIEPNPSIETLRKAISLGKEKKIDFILAVGGGSVIDGSKLVSAGLLYEGDAWDLVKKGELVTTTVPLASVLTLPATGSEMNKTAVISSLATKEKFPFLSNYPVFSILDPEVTYSLPSFQIACGLVDTFIHIMEQYMTTTNQSQIMDRWAEGLIQTLVGIAPEITAKNRNYSLMSDFMLTSTLALNGFISLGVTQDWATHRIGHELTALHGMTHAATLAIVFPGTLRVMAQKKQAKILQFGERIWNITEGSAEKRVEKTIQKIEEFFRNAGLSTHLSEENIGDDTINEICRRFEVRNVKLGEDGDIDSSVIRKILVSCK